MIMGGSMVRRRLQIGTQRITNMTRLNKYISSINGDGSGLKLGSAAGFLDGIGFNDGSGYGTGSASDGGCDFGAWSTDGKGKLYRIKDKPMVGNAEVYCQHSGAGFITGFGFGFGGGDGAGDESGAGSFCDDEYD